MTRAAVAGALCLLLAAWAAYRAPAATAAGIDHRVAPAQATGQTYVLPFSWNGPDTVTPAELAEVASPLVVLDVEGDFQIVRVASPEGDTIRILSQSSGQPGAQPSITLGWRLPDPEQEVPLPGGQTVSLSTAARLYSPPEGVQLTIGEAQGGEWASSSVTMDGVSWADYTVSRAIAPEAEEILVGIAWQPSIENAWLEFRGLTVTAAAAAAAPDRLSPTDTPTPIPAPPATPTPEALPPTSTPEEAPAEPAMIAEPAPIIVTSTPTPVDVFEEATRVMLATEQAASVGTATATPEGVVTATFTPSPIVVTNTPTPANLVTATYAAILATARALTTGTPTPYPPEVAVLVATDTPMPTPTVPQLRATNTPTPIFRYLEDITTAVPTATPVFPAELQGKILFLSDMFGTIGRPNAFMINPDGTGLALLTGREFHTRAKARDAYSADKRFYAFAQRADGPGKGGLVQVYFNDAEYGSTDQLTFFGAGTAWAPTWSPRDQVVALVSSESRNDEIWLVRPTEWPPRKLTENNWEWDKSPSFSPDGSQIVFESNRISGVRQLWLMDAGGGEPRQFTFLDGFEAWEPVWVKYLDD